MKVHSHTKLCFICLFTFIFHHCNHCHEDVQDHTSGENDKHSSNDYQIAKESYHRTRAKEFSTSTSSAADAEHEQKYYIEKLFHRYGENGRLSFYGLEKLLDSLGLGEVKVVGIVHEDIGHDHVSHLDALDVQERKHYHDHSHVDVANDTKSPASAKVVNKCDNRNVDVFVQTNHKNIHNHSHHHHGLNGTHHHNGSHHSHNGTASQGEHGGHNAETLSDTNTTQDQRAGKHHKRKKSRKGTQSTQTPADPTPEFVSGHAHDEHNHVQKTNPFEGSHLQDHEANNHADHESEENLMPARRGSTRKREAPHDDHVKVKDRDIEIHKDHSEDLHSHDECLNVTELLRYYGLSSPISPDQFAFLCPALLYQIDSRFCIKHLAELEMENLDTNKSEYSAWICGFISITVISLLSLLGVILIPIINQGCFKYLLNFLVALAVGTLSGDALLHLLPHSQGGHDHSNEEHEHGGHEESRSLLEQYDSILKGLVALGGIYLLFIVEHCLRMFKHYKEQKGKQKWLNRKVDESSVGRKLSDHKLNRRSDAEWLQLKPVSGVDDSMASEVQRLNETEMTYVDGLQQSPTKEYIPAEDMSHANKDGSYDDDHSLEDGQYGHNHQKVEMPKKHNHSKHSHHSHGHCHSGKDMKDTGIASIAWMVIMGDGMHNFSDGLAIGAAFSAGLPGGISTSVAVFCHELPHELGDFAVLLKAGMTVNQAIVYNLLSAMMAYVGMLIGTAVGQYAENITLWIFAVTAGMFLYVALVDMLPEMLHGDAESEHCPIGHFTLQNLGLLCGFAIMLIIALYEDKLVIDIPF